VLCSFGAQSITLLLVSKINEKLMAEKMTSLMMRLSFAAESWETITRRYGNRFPAICQ
jgi:hypothetical protein